MKIEFDDGFAFGKGLFETIKVVDKRPIMLYKHLKRINKGLKELNIDNYIKETDVLNYINNETEVNYALKIIATDKNTLIIKRKDNYIGLNRNEGIELKISNIIRNSTSHMVYYKSLNYYDNIIEKKKATEEGYKEVIFLNEKGDISEGAVSNIFFIKDKKIFTPSLNSGILAGTMREYIIDHYDVQEKNIDYRSLENYDSAFITNSLFGVQWIRKIDKIQFEKTELIYDIIKNIEKMGY